MNEPTTEDFSVLKSKIFIGHTKPQVNEEEYMMFEWEDSPQLSDLKASKPISYRSVISVKHGGRTEKSLGWTLTFEPCSVSFNPLAPGSFVRGWWEPPAELTEREENSAWGKTRNLFPQLALISPRRVYFTLTHKQSLARGRWRGKT